MLFHPTFGAERERRLTFDGLAATPAEGAPATPSPAELPPEKQKIKDELDQIKEKVKDNPEAIQELANFEALLAEQDEAELQQKYRDALTNAANAYHEDLLKIPGSDALKTVNEAFAPAGVVFALKDGKLTIGAEVPVSEEEKPALSPEDEKLVQDIVSIFPENLNVMAKKIATELIADPKNREGANEFYTTFQALSPQAQEAVIRDADAYFNEGKGMKHPSEVQKEFKAAFAAMSPEGQIFAKQLIENVKVALTESEQDLSGEERADIIDGAKKELETFDATKASEIDKNIMLARIQMRGIDTSNPDEIFAKPPVLKVTEGSPMERGFSKIMGLIGYVLLSIQKMKGQLNPEKKTETPAGQPAAEAEAPASAPEKEGIRQKLRAEIKAKSINGDQLIEQKTIRQKVVQQESQRLEETIAELNKADDEEGRVALESENGPVQELQRLKQENLQLTQEISMLEEMKEEATKSAKAMDQSRIVVGQLATALPDDEARKVLTSSLLFEVKPDEQYRLTLKPMDGLRDVTIGTIKDNLTKVLSSRLGKALAETIHFDGEDVLQNPSELTQALEGIAQDIREEIANKKKPTPPAAPGGPPAAP